MKVTGWIAMMGGEYEGLWPMDEPHPVYFDKDKAEAACKALKGRGANAPDIVEVEINIIDAMAQFVSNARERDFEWIVRPAMYDPKDGEEWLARFRTDTEAEAFMAETYPHRDPATYYTPSYDEGYIETDKARR